MTDVEPVVTDFASTGRTGRRNAMPDILGSTAGPGASELQQKLSDLKLGDDEQGGEGSSTGNSPQSPEAEKTEGS
ncbi:cAMP-dependent protein kinase inhibitor beta isoform X2 [Denticeps clupeoides]|uniref:cAMP-dependent protein kinase inhibitor n=1 Tax=Denticeps clupeoides TaxID=299321 RepID=A0AAY4EQB1_9TELE|nr:cAMP-dependent protein kinase inhibitor beta isoform X2 [Denticeps clupeoides]